ncbi:MAG: hypothetical protein BGP11_08340 [Rhodobacterales bacterium 65-51]|uniref:hypothetical protein n=1 Tax=uncultured Gemmobacter sp. TaxID=1095917 RepID=UPI00095E9307|nr:hypothetical protein [uncultured Gemmobacter sp.]OJY36344.1 MAG: hypothetical protein BGP11_08340 [Rhodobacterales bacterium 65-51]
MTITLRDRPDGQVELVVQKPVVVGVLADRDLAERFVAFLTGEDDAEQAELVLGSVTAPDDGVERIDLEQIAEELAPTGPARKASSRSRKAQLPVVVEKPKAPALLPVVRPALTDAQLDEAFGLLGGGEKLSAVAIRFGVPMSQLRGYWAQHRKQMQRHLADGGQQPCSLCQKPFTPSISRPDTCARCSHE